MNNIFQKLSNIDIIYKLCLILCLSEIYIFIFQIMFLSPGESGDGSFMECKSKLKYGIAPVVYIVITDLLFIGAVIGLFLYYNLSRFLFILALILYIGSVVFIDGPIIVNKYESMSSYIAFISIGVVLSMISCSPISKKFK